MPKPTAATDTQVFDGNVFVAKPFPSSGYSWKRADQRVIATSDSAVNAARLAAAAAAYPEIYVDTGDHELLLNDAGYIGLGNTSVYGYRGDTAMIDLQGTSRIGVGVFKDIGTINTHRVSCTVDADGMSLTSATLTAAVGDWLVVLADDPLPGLTHFAGGTTRPLEMVRVGEVSGTTFYFDRPLVDVGHYTTAYVVNVTQNPNFTDSRRIRAENLDLSLSSKTGGTGTKGLELHFCSDFVVRNLDNTNSGSLFISGCIDGRIESFRNDGQLGDNAIYGMVLNSSDSIVVSDFVFRNGARHGITTGGWSVDDLHRYGTLARILIRDGKVYGSALTSTGSMLFIDSHAEGNGIIHRDIDVYLAGDSDAGSSEPILYAFSSRSRNSVFERCRVHGRTGQYHIGIRLSNPAGSYLVDECELDGGYVGVLGVPDSAGKPSPSMMVRKSAIRDMSSDGIMLDGGDLRVVDTDIENCGDTVAGITGAMRASINHHDTSGNGQGTLDIRRCKIVKGAANSLYSVSIGNVSLDDSRLQSNTFEGFEGCFFGLDTSDPAAISLLRRDFGLNNDRQKDVRFVTVSGHSLDLNDHKYYPILRDGTVHDDGAAISDEDEILGLLIGISGDVLCLATYGHVIQLDQEYLPASYSFTADSHRLYFDTDLSTSHTSSKTGAFATTNNGDGSNPVVLRVDHIDSNTITARVAIGL